MKKHINFKIAEVKTKDTLPRHKLLWAQNACTLDGMDFSLYEQQASMKTEENKILGAALESPANQPC